MFWWPKAILFLGLFFLVITGSRTRAQPLPSSPGNFPNEEAVAEVLAGRIEVANAAWWGFNESDSTRALQEAIHSGAEKVIVPYMGRDWIVKPIHLVSNQEILFEPGVVVTHCSTISR